MKAGVQHQSVKFLMPQAAKQRGAVAAQPSKGIERHTAAFRHFAAPFQRPDQTEKQGTVGADSFNFG